MHVILGLLGTVVTVLYLLHRLAEMGIDLGRLNPFYWPAAVPGEKNTKAIPYMQ